IVEVLLDFLEDDLSHSSSPIAAPYFTAPNVSPRTSWRCDSQPSTTMGAIAIVDAAESFAQNRPSGLEYEAMTAVSGAASAVVRVSVPNASFQARMTFSSTLEAMPGSAIGART